MSTRLRSTGVVAQTQWRWDFHGQGGFASHGSPSGCPLRVGSGRGLLASWWREGVVVWPCLVLFPFHRLRYASNTVVERRDCRKLLIPAVLVADVPAQCMAGTLKTHSRRVRFDAVKETAKIVKAVPSVGAMRGSGLHRKPRASIRHDLLQLGQSILRSDPSRFITGHVNVA